MSNRKALPLVIGLIMAAPAMANTPYQEEFVTTLTMMGPAIGKIDYCLGGGQAQFDAYMRGLENFRLHPREMQALLVMTQADREKGRADAAQKYGGRPCPANVRKTMRRARQQMDDAWRQIVANAASLDLRPAVATVLGTSSAAPASGPAPAPASTRDVPAALPPAPPPTPAGSAASSAGLCVKGRAVSVLHAGDWYPAKVLDGPDNMGTCLVSYDNYDSNWDEWVSAKRMRAAAGQSSPTAVPPPPATPTSVPPGKYSCYTFDNGMLNYTYTDVQILDGSRYAVGSKSGTYSLAKGGAMRFTGTMSNATGKFSVKNTGKPQIDLVFNGDARASMACSKAN